MKRSLLVGVLCALGVLLHDAPTDRRVEPVCNARGHAGPITLRGIPFIYDDGSGAKKYGVTFLDERDRFVYIETGEARLQPDGRYDINLGALDGKISCLDCHNVSFVMEELTSVR